MAGAEGQIAGLAYIAIGKSVGRQILASQHGGEFATLFAGANG